MTDTSAMASTTMTIPATGLIYNPQVRQARMEMDTQLVQAESERRTNPRLALTLAQAAEAPAREQGDGRAIADSLRIQAECNLYFDRHEIARAQAEEAYNLYVVRDDGQGQAQTLVQIGTVHQREGNYPAALEFFTRSLGLSEGHAYTEAEGDAYQALGTNYMRAEQYADAQRLLHRALEIHTEIGDPGIWYTMHSLATMFEETQDYARALEIHLANLTRAEQTNNRRAMGFALNGVGSVHRHLNQGEAALGFYLRATRIWEEEENPYRLSVSYNNLATIYSLLENPALALTQYQRALEVGTMIHHRQLVMAALSNLGDTYCEMGNYEQGLIHLTRALQLMQEVGMRSYEAQTRLALALVYDNKDFAGYDPDRAIEQLNQVLTIAQEMQIVQQAMQAYEMLAGIHEGQSDLAQALRCYREFHRLSKEAFTEELERKVHQLQARYGLAQQNTTV